MRKMLAAICLSVLFLAAPGAARAQDCVCCVEPCDIEWYQTTKQHLQDEGKETREHITDEFQKHQTWVVHDFWRDYMLPALKNMAAQLTAVGLYQTEIIGTFLDAKHQLETQQTLEELAARAHRDYQPSMELCKVGSISSGLAPAGRNAQANAVILAQRSQDRQLGNFDTVAAESFFIDRAARVKNMKELYCDPKDHNEKADEICTGSSRLNNDIDYARMMGDKAAMDLDFSDQNLSNDETDFMALATNLFAHDVFSRPSGQVIKIRDNQDEFLDARAVVAKRSVAENSFYAIAALKSNGPANGTPDRLLAQMSAQNYAGPRPSYYSMLEILAQKMYQDPSFYANLYETPANVARKDVAMQAIGLMLDRNRYKSDLRTEAMMAVWLETEIAKYQDDVENQMNWLSDTGVDEDPKEQTPAMGGGN